METAIGAAKNGGGVITCLHARIDVIETAAIAESMFPQHGRTLETIRHITEEEAERHRKARLAFDSAIKAHGLLLNETAAAATVAVRWKETKSFLNETLEETRYHDVTVMAREHELSPERIKSVLLQSGRPLILAAPKPLPAIGRRIAIAWKEGPEAARAITAAGPWLADAQSVVILSVSQRDYVDDDDRSSAERLAKRLSERGIQAQVETACSPLSSETTLLQNKAYDFDADLLVMGAYGHSRLREFILGGVTEGMLKDCAVPLLMFS
jgi:nucleotide-binding universal stress UspA family protein